MAEAAPVQVASIAQQDAELVARRLIDLRRRAELEGQARAELEGKARPDEGARLFFRDFHGTVYFFRNGPGQAALRIQPVWARQAFEWRLDQAHIWEANYNINLLRIATVPNYSLYNRLKVRDNLGVTRADQHFLNRLQIPFLAIDPRDKSLHPVSDLHARLLTMYRAMTLHAELNGGFWQVKYSDNGVHEQKHAPSHAAAIFYHPLLKRRVIFLVARPWTGADDRIAIERKAIAAFQNAQEKYPPGKERDEGAARDVERVFEENNCVMMVFPPCEFGVATLYAKHKDKRYALEVGGIFLSQDNVDHWIPREGRGPRCPCCIGSRIRDIHVCPVHAHRAPHPGAAARA